MSCKLRSHGELSLGVIEDSFEDRFSLRFGEAFDCISQGSTGHPRVILREKIQHCGSDRLPASRNIQPTAL